MKTIIYIAAAALLFWGAWLAVAPCDCDLCVGGY